MNKQKSTDFAPFPDTPDSCSWVSSLSQHIRVSFSLSNGSCSGIRADFVPSVVLSTKILPSRPSEQVLIKVSCSIFTSSLALQQSSAKSDLFLVTGLSELSHSLAGFYVFF